MAEQRFNADVVVGDRTQALLRPRRLLPSQWEIPPAERQRIKGANIKLGIVFPPASQLSLTSPGASSGERIYIVTIEPKALDAYELSRREIVALILHDATEARQKTFEAIESERLQALTLLAASVAQGAIRSRRPRQPCNSIVPRFARSRRPAPRHRAPSTSPTARASSSSSA